MRILVFIVCLLTLPSLKAQDKLIEYFELTETDSFHIRPFNYFKVGPQPLNDFRDFTGKVIPKGFDQLASFDSLFHPINFFANEVIKLDSSNYAAITVVQQQDVYDSFVMILILNEAGELQTFFQAASWKYLEGTMEETQNSWLFDEDGDGDLDICMMTDLLDFELPVEDAPNISGTTALLYRNNKVDFEAEYISEKLWKLLRVEK